MKKYLFYTLLLSYTLQSQNIPLPQNLVSPTAADLGKYGDVPVSLNKGTVNIEVPLYSLNVNSVPLNVTLTYDASGVLVGGLPSWVGQNWSLNAGGVITRQVNYWPDEFSKGSGSTITSKGYFYPESYGRLNVSNWSTDSNLQVIDKSNYGEPSLPYPGLGKESQPDIFTFNFMGYTGKFFLGEDGEWKVASESNLKVKVLETDFIYPFGETYTPSGEPASKCIGKIELTDDKGIVYTFGFVYNGSSEKAIEFSKSFYGQRTEGWVATTWYLVQVSAPTTTSALTPLYTLVYERDANFMANFYRYRTSYKFNATYDNSGILNSNPGGCAFSILSDDGTGNPEVIGGSLIAPVYLKTITTMHNEILTFSSMDSAEGFYKTTLGSSTLPDYWNTLGNYWNAHMGPTYFGTYYHYLMPYNNGTDILNKLKYKRLTGISSNFNTPSTTFTYNTNDPTHATERLNLVKVEIGGLKKYTFDYDQFNLLPGYLEKTNDHLGYYDGTAYSTTNFSTYLAQRNSDATKVKYGSLIKITYPTKGFSEFEYEINNYSRYVKNDKSGINTISNAIIGGIRIKRVKNNDDNGNVEIKDYKYVKNYVTNHASTSSSGILTNLPQYYWPDFRVRSLGISGQLSLESFSTNPIIQLGNFFGSPISYDEVVEVNSDGSYTLYKYTNHDDYMDEAFDNSFNITFSPFEKFNDRSLLRGKLKSKEVYNSSNVLVARTFNEYSVNGGLNIKFVRGTNIQSMSCPFSPGQGWYFGNAYRIYYFDNDVIKSTESTFLNGQEVKVEKKYNYAYYPNLTTSIGDRFMSSNSVQTYLDEGQTGSEKMEEFSSYPFDIASTINTTLISKRILPVLQKQVKRNGEIISSERMEYGIFSNLLLPKKQQGAKGSNALEDNVIIDEYDVNGNIAKYHTPQGMYTVLYWCYNKKYPVIRMEGSELASTSYAALKISEIQTLLGSNLSGWLTNLDAIVSKLNEVRLYYPTSRITGCAYSPVNNEPACIVLPDGSRTYYTYDALGRLKYIKDESANVLNSYEYNFKTP